MKYFIIILFSFLAIQVNGEDQSYIGNDYYLVQEMIWEYGDSITDIDYDKKIIYFCNRDNGVIYYTGEIYFDDNWTSFKTKTYYVNYLVGYSPMDYLNSLRCVESIKIKGRSFYLDGFLYRVSRQRGKLLITETKAKI